MPPAKKVLPPEDSRSDASTVRERQIAAAAHARKSKQNAAAAAAAAKDNGSLALKELAAVSAETGGREGPGMAWNTSPLSLLNTYRVSHHLSTPAAFTSPLNQALLVNPGIGRQSPTMARRKDKRRVSKDQLATNVRKHFNGAAVNEIDVVVELVYKSRNKDKAFRMRSAPGITKKS
ncbi:hypothetical protein MBLNU13_g02882t1 [Cladosporium sp. NU13]